MPPHPDAVRQLLQRIASRVRTERHSLGWTMSEAAHHAGLSQRFYAQVEAAQANIAIGRLWRLADALQIPLLDLLAEEAPAPSAATHSLGIALLGIRGSGKSTLGQALAAELDLPLLEIDDAIAQRAGLRLAEIFALHGEAYYRRLGAEVLQDCIRQQIPQVLAVPGGLVLDEEAWTHVHKHFTTIWLRTDPEDCMQRVLAQGDLRPMAGHADAMAELRRLLSNREPFYRRAALTLDTSAASLPEVRQQLFALVQPLPKHP